MNWSGDLADRLAKFGAEVYQHLEDDLATGAEVILADAELRVPKESGDLAGTGRVAQDRGGNSTVAIVFESVYARWIHEHLHFKHPHGGEAKYLETAMLTKGEEALQVTGERLWGRA